MLARLRSDGRPFGQLWASSRSSPFAFASPPRARYTLVRDFGSFYPSRLDRLDARPRLRPDVPDALLRRLARRRCPQHQLSESIGTLGHAAGAPLSFSSRNFLRLGHRQTASQEPDSRRDHPQNGPPRRPNPGLWTPLPPAGISHRLGMGPLVRLTPRRRAEHHRTIHDPDGANLRYHSGNLPKSAGFVSGVVRRWFVSGYAFRHTPSRRKRCGL